MEMINSIAAHPYFADSKIRIMPDTHAGAGIVVGFTCTLGERVNPEHIGADIGCGIEIQLFDKVLSPADYPLFEQRIRNVIPMGKDINAKREFDLKDFCKYVRRELNRATQQSGGLVHEVPFSTERDISAWCKPLNLDERTFYKSIGSLGGGNHFIALDYNEEGQLLGVTVHTGSRNIGQKVCRRWARKATATAGFLTGGLLEQYLTDMVIAQAYAQYNRKVILDKIAAIYRKMCKGKVVEQISSVHNYLDFSDMIIRKGAIRAYRDERMIIPFNMRDGIAICEGKSNDDWNCSAPHGAGRLLSRAKARESLAMNDFTQAMQGIYSTSVTEATLDESPMAYKDTRQIIDQIQPTCDILYFMHPVVNIKDTSTLKIYHN